LKRKNEVRGWLVISLLIFFVISADQISKFSINKLGFVINCNKGIAFGLGQDVTAIAIAVLIVVFGLLIYEKQQLTKISLALIFAGGVSNLIDRIFVGCVRDFIKVGFWPAFNLADSAITVGVLLFLLTLFKDKR